MAQIEGKIARIGKPLQSFVVDHPGEFVIGARGDFELIFADLLNVDLSYQRELNQRRINELVRGFDNAIFGILIASHRDDGLLYVVDGQHRLAAVKIKYPQASALVPCYVIRGINHKGEADLFWKMNKHRLTLASGASFKARLEAGDRAARDIRDICAQFGINIMTYPGPLGSHSVYAVGALDAVFRAGDLPWVLATIRTGWPNTDNALKGIHILGMWRFLQRWREDLVGDFGKGGKRVERLRTQVMPIVSPTTIGGRAQIYKEQLQSKSPTAWARALHYFYNLRFRSNPLALPTWEIGRDEDPPPPITFDGWDR